MKNPLTYQCSYMPVGDIHTLVAVSGAAEGTSYSLQQKFRNYKFLD